MNDKSNYLYLFKYVIVGGFSVGKSCLLLQFLQKKFIYDQEPTIGVEFGAKIVDIDGRKIKLQIWDTAGQETFRSITRSYYRSSIGIIVVYDISNRESFDMVANWLEETKNYANDKACVILVGSKNDLEGRQLVTFEEGAAFAKNNGLDFLQCSAKTSFHVDLVFTKLTETIMNKINKKIINPMTESLGIKLGQQLIQPSIDPEPRYRFCRC